MTFVRADANSIYRTEIWQLVAPATGNKTISVTLSLSVTSIANAASYTGVDQTTPIEINAGANGVSNPASASVTTGFVRDRVFGAISTKTASGVTVASGQASRASNTGALGTGASADCGAVDVAASKTLTWNGITTLDNWAVSLAAIKPVQPLTAITGGIPVAGFATGQSKASGKVPGILFASAFTSAQSKAAGKLNGIVFAASSIAATAKGAAAAKSKGFSAAFSEGAPQAAGKLQVKSFIGTSAAAQVKAAGKLQGSAFAGSFTSANLKATAALGGKVAVSSTTEATPLAAGKLQAKVGVSAFADGQSTATAVLRGTSFVATFAVDKLVAPARLQGEAAVTVSIDGTLTADAAARGIAFVASVASARGRLQSPGSLVGSATVAFRVSGKPTSVTAIAPVTAVPNVGGSAGIRRHGLTRPAPQPLLIRANAQLSQAAHECTATVRVKKLVIPARAECVHAPAVCDSRAIVTIRGTAALVHPGLLVRGQAREDTTKLDAELADYATALSWMAEHEEAAELSCK